MASSSVLIIDDEPVAREAVAQDLKREGYDLHFAENGKEGLSLVRGAAPTVIILDLRMPVMDGQDFLNAIELKPSDPYSVIVLTGHGDSNAIKACYDAGVSTFIKKPFNLYEIRGVVKNAIVMKELTNNLDAMVGEQTATLEQRVQEVTALNQLFQKALNRASVTDTEFGEITEGLQRLASNGASLAKRTQSLSNIQENTGSAEDPDPRPEYRGIMEGLQELAQDATTLAMRAKSLSSLEDDKGLQKEAE